MEGGMCFGQDLEFALQNRYGPVRDIRKMADDDIRRQLLSPLDIISELETPA